MDLRETARNALAHLNFRVKKQPISPVCEQPIQRELPQRVEFEYEYPTYLKAKSRFGEDAVKDQPYRSESGEELSQLHQRRELFLRDNRGLIYDENKFPELLETVIQGPNAKPFIETFTLVRDAINTHWGDCTEKNEYQTRHQEAYHYKSISMFLPETVIETAPPSLKKLVKDAQIPAVPYKHDYYGIDTSGILVDLHHSDEGRMSMGIGGLSDSDERYSQRFDLEMNLFWDTSNLQFRSFELSFQTPNELRRYIESFNDEARRARLFNTLAKFFAKSLDNPDIVSLNHLFDNWVSRSRPKVPQVV